MHYHLHFEFFDGHSHSIPSPTHRSTSMDLIRAEKNKVLKENF